MDEDYTELPLGARLWVNGFGCVFALWLVKFYSHVSATTDIIKDTHTPLRNKKLKNKFWYVLQILKYTIIYGCISVYEWMDGFKMYFISPFLNSLAWL